MEKRTVEHVVAALNRHEVRFLMVGGLAVVAHGYLRATRDIDLVVALDEPNVRRAVRALEGEGYRPTIPVPFDDYADEVTRLGWVQNKGAVVLRVHSDQHPSTTVDLFLEVPFDFEQVYATAIRVEVGPGIEATVVSLDVLIEMKRRAARPQDLADIHQLEAIRERLADEA